MRGLDQLLHLLRNLGEYLRRAQEFLNVIKLIEPIKRRPLTSFIFAIVLNSAVRFFRSFRTAGDLVFSKSSLLFAEREIVLFSAIVVFGCIGEALETNWWKQRHRIFAIWVALGVTGETFSDAEVYEASDALQSAAEAAVAQANSSAANANLEAQRLKQAAAIIEERLLGERRLTARERMRLERVERAVLPRSLYVDWQSLVATLRAGKFSSVCITSVPSGEPREFALDLSLAFTQAGNPARFIMWPSDPKIVAEIGSGVTNTVVGDDGVALARMLWNKFRIGGGILDARTFAPDWKDFPRGMPCIVVGENDAALQAQPGQPGEGRDKYGGPDPAPH